MNKRVFFGIASLAMIFLGSQVFAAPTVTIVAPTLSFTGTGTGATLALNQAYASALNTAFASPEFNATINKIKTDSETQLSKYGSQTKLGEGFGNANVYSAQSGTLQGYQGYKTFAVMGGLLVGAQLPSFDPNQVTKMFESMQTNPDIYAGLAPSVTYLNVGINAETVFGLFNKNLGKTLKNFYFNVKGGGLNQTFDIDSSTKLVMASTTFGIGANYQFLPSSPSIMFGLFKWRGLNFGTGFNYQANKIDFTLTMAKITQSMPITSFTSNGVTVNPEATFSVKPKVNVGVEMNTFSIPLEATTSVQLLWLSNINFGVGADLVFGSTTIKAIVDSPLNIDSFTTGLTGTGVTASTTPGKVTIDASTKNVAPSLVRARIMTGFGLQAGPVKIDMPIYYYLASGLAFGLSAGIVW